MLLVVILCFPIPVRADTFIVNTPDDTDDGMCDDNHCSLREAFQYANENPGPDTISFAGLDATNGDITITLNSHLGMFSDDGTTIDGTTVLGYQSEPLINIVDGQGSLEAAISLGSDNNVVRGLSIAGFGLFPQNPNPDPWDYYGGAVLVYGEGNVIENNVLGWGALPNSVGLRLDGPGNIASGNVVSGNGIGIYIDEPSQTITSNKIGVDGSGGSSNPNAYGIYVHAGSGGGHMIGGPGAGNVISGNDYGLYLNSGNTTVQGNYIGTDASGTYAVGNDIAIYLEGTNNLIGGPGAGEGNLISGNDVGIWSRTACTGTSIQGNKIGSDASGNAPLGNNGAGIRMWGSGIQIGGLGPGEGNLIMANGASIDLEGGNEYPVLGNTITQNGKGVVTFVGSESSNLLISQNSIFDNDGLGIQTNFAGPNDYPEPPELLEATSTSVHGNSSCGHLCLVEVFLADPDPSGAGEGKTYLASATTLTQIGDFTATFTPPQPEMFCQTLTATVTYPGSITSEFSQNLLINCRVIEPPFLYPLWTFIITVFGVIGILIRRHNPSLPGLMVPGGFLLGGLVGGLVFGLLNLLPGVMVNFTPEETVLYSSSLPDCSDYLNPDGYSPADGAILEPSDELNLSWAFTGNLPEGDIQWLVNLDSSTAPGGMAPASDSSIALSAFGISPQREGTYLWSISGQQLLPDGETWLPFCNPGERLTFQILSAEDEAETEEEEEVEEPTATPTEEPAPTEKPEDCDPTVTALLDLNCRVGPGTGFENVGTLLEGESALVDGQNSAGTWVWILNPDAMGHCWVWREGVEEVCMPERLQIIADPTAEPESACQPDLERAECGAAGGVYDVTADPPECKCP